MIRMTAQNQDYHKHTITDIDTAAQECHYCVCFFFSHLFTVYVSEREGGSVCVSVVIQLHGWVIKTLFNTVAWLGD